jgi:chromosome segregation ATPase
LDPFSDVLQAAETAELRERLATHAREEARVKAALDAAEAVMRDQGQELEDAFRRLAEASDGAAADRNRLEAEIEAVRAAAAAATETAHRSALTELQTELQRQARELAEARAALAAEQEKQRDLVAAAAPAPVRQRSLADAFNFVPGVGPTGAGDGGSLGTEQRLHREQEAAQLREAAEQARREAAEARTQLAAAADEMAAREESWQEQAAQLRGALAETEAAAEQTRRQSEVRYPPPAACLGLCKSLASSTPRAVG